MSMAAIGNDKNYLKRLKEIWTSLEINIPTFTADGLPTNDLKRVLFREVLLVLIQEAHSADFELAAKINPGVPAL